MMIDGLELEIAPPSAVLGERTPAAIAFTARVFGGGAPSLDTGFTYLDLGSGPGINVAVLAEVYRQGRFYGLDPDAGNIAKANALKETFWIENAEFHECALTDVLSKDLPKFDFISLTSSYTMLSIESQSKVRALIGTLLKPEGAVLVRYASNPGNMPFSMMNVWGKLLFERHEGTNRERITKAFSVMKDVVNKDALLHEILPKAHLVVEDAARRDPDYMSLYFKSEGDGMWFHDIAEHMEATGLYHAGSTLPEFNLMHETAEIDIAVQLSRMKQAYDDPIIEQELISTLTIISSRADVFCKQNETRLPSLEQVQDYYIQPVYIDNPEILLAEVQKTTVADLSQEIYLECLKSLDFFGDRIGYFLRKCPARFTTAEWERAVLHLICLGICQISPNPLKAIEDETVRYGQHFTMSKLVTYILKSHIGLDEIVNLPAPAIGTTATLNQLERLLCLAVVEGGLDAVWSICQQAGFYPRKLPSDTVVASEAEFIETYTPFLERFKTAVLPNLARRGVVSVL